MYWEINNQNLTATNTAGEEYCNTTTSMSVAIYNYTWQAGDENQNNATLGNLYWLNITQATPTLSLSISPTCGS